MSFVDTQDEYLQDGKPLKMLKNDLVQPFQLPVINPVVKIAGIMKSPLLLTPRLGCHIPPGSSALHWLELDCSVHC